MKFFTKGVATLMIAVFSWQTMGVSVASVVKSHDLAEKGKAVQQASEEWKGFETLNPLTSFNNFSRGVGSSLSEEESTTTLELVTDNSLVEKLNARLDTYSGQDLMTSGDAKIRRNNMGSLIVNSSTGSVAGNTFDFSETSPMIWARFYPDRSQGYIQIYSMRRNPYPRTPDGEGQLNSSVEFRNKVKDLRAQTSDIKQPLSYSKDDLVDNTKLMDPYIETETLTLGPEDGIRLAADNGVKSSFRNTNPFKDFIPTSGQSGDKVYSNVSLGAFMAIVGTWARHYGTQRGYVAVGQTYQNSGTWDECKRRVIGVCVKRRYHTESYAIVRPVWYALSSGDNAIGKSKISAFKARDCLSASASQRINQSMGDNDCVVFSGVGFLQVSNNTDIPNGWMNFWHQHDHVDKSNWWPIIAIVLAVVTFGLSLALGPLMLGLETMMTFAAGTSLLGSQILVAMAVMEGVMVGLASGIVGYLTQSKPGSMDLTARAKIEEIIGQLGFGVAKDPASAYAAIINDDNNNLWSPGACAVGLNKRPAASSQPYASEDAPGKSRYRYGPVKNGEAKFHFNDLPANGCEPWLVQDLRDMKGAVGEFYNIRKPNKARNDYGMPNEVEQIKRQQGVLQRWDDNQLNPILKRQ